MEDIYFSSKDEYLGAAPAELRRCQKSQFDERVVNAW